MRRYRPTPAPLSLDRELSRWLTGELTRIADSVDSVYEADLSNKAPSKARDGMIVYADGTYWNPDAVSGQGFYGYWASAWHFFGGTGGAGNITVYHSNETQSTRDEIGTRDKLNFIDTEDTLENVAQGWVTWTITDDGTQGEIEVVANVSLPSGTPEGLGDAADTGSETTVALSDHVHKRDVRVAKEGTDIGTRNRLNFIAGSGITLTISDDSGNDEVDITIAVT